MSTRAQSLGRAPLFATPRTVAHPVRLSMGLSRQEAWSGLPCPPPGVLPDPGIASESPASSAFGRRVLHTSAAWEALSSLYLMLW